MDDQKPNHDEVASVKDVKDMTVAERHTYDVCDFILAFHHNH